VIAEDEGSEAKFARSLMRRLDMADRADKTQKGTVDFDVHLYNNPLRSLLWPQKPT
jgi:hypothetical protein